MYGYIYKVTNNVNGKIYIGQKKSSIFLGEKYLGSGTLIKGAILKYGLENFTVELLKECPSKKLLDFYEEYYIKEYHSRDPLIGYNTSIGGRINDSTAKNYYRTDEEAVELRDIYQYNKFLEEKEKFQRKQLKEQKKKRD